MLTVLFDTNILHQEGLYSSRIQRFQRLLKNSECQLIIPEIVIKEYKSKRISIVKEELSKMEQCFNKLQQKNFLQKNEGYMLHSFNHTVQKCIENVSTEIDSWVNEYNIDVYKISNTSIDTLFTNYFEGKGAFRKAKYRDDIPDAVIYDAIINIAKSKKISVVLRDGAFKEALENVENVTCYSSLDDFLNVESIKEITLKFDNQNSRINEILSFLGSIDCSINLQSYFSKIGINGIGYSFSKEYLNFPFDYDGIKLINPEVLASEYDKEKDFYFHDPHYLGGNKFSISFIKESKAYLSFHCHAEEYEYLPYKVRKQFNTKKTEDSTILHVSGEIDVEFKGVVTISNIIEELTPKEVKVHFTYLDSEECEISCTLDIESVEITDIY